MAKTFTVGFNAPIFIRNRSARFALHPPNDFGILIIINVISAEIGRFEEIDSQLAFSHFAPTGLKNRGKPWRAENVKSKIV